MFQVDREKIVYHVCPSGNFLIYKYASVSIYKNGSEHM
jgi:hypothetical protein